MDRGTRSEPVVGRAERHVRSAGQLTKRAGGESEGFEHAEQALIESTAHGDQRMPVRVMRVAGPDEESAGSVYGEADSEHHDD